MPECGVERANPYTTYGVGRGALHARHTPQSQDHKNRLAQPISHHKKKTSTNKQYKQQQQQNIKKKPTTTTTKQKIKQISFSRVVSPCFGSVFRLRFVCLWHT